MPDQKISHRKVTPEQVAEQLRGGHRLAPGFWVGRDGALHVSVPELLAYVRLPDTEANRAHVLDMVTKEFARQLPAVTEIVVQD